jgi:hypothetical protein
LHGYAYDSFNPDALLNLASVKNGDIETVKGNHYKLLVLPGRQPMLPDGKAMSPETAAKILQMVEAGATILVDEKYDHSWGLKNALINDKMVAGMMNKLWSSAPSTSTGMENQKVWSFGKGHVIVGPYLGDSFDDIGIERDFIAKDSSGALMKSIVWTHRQSQDGDIYFVSSQENKENIVNLSLRVKGRIPEIWNPVTGETQVAKEWKIESNRTLLPVKLDANGSLFVVLQQPALKLYDHRGENWLDYRSVLKLDGSWELTFDPKAGGPKVPVMLESLLDWSKDADTCIRYYSGTAKYSKSFKWDNNTKERIWINLGEIANIADVKVNGISCGIAWTPPYRIEITKAIKPGVNQLNIEVTNTWANRLIGDHALPEKDRITWTTAPFRLEGKPLLKAGLLGPVSIAVSY